MAKYLDENKLKKFAAKISELFVKNAPDSQYYVRKKGSWVKLSDAKLDMDKNKYYVRTKGNWVNLSSVIVMGAETVKITLRTNQQSQQDIMGKSIIHIKYDDKDIKLTWNGQPISYKIPDGKQYTVSFDEISGYKTPLPITYDAKADNERQVSAMYETCIITVKVFYSGGHGVAVGHPTIQYDNITLTYNGEPVKIPYDKDVTITCSDTYEGYDTPNPQKIHTHTPQEVISMKYEILYVIFFARSNLGGISGVVGDPVRDKAFVTLTWGAGESKVLKDFDKVVGLPRGTQVTCEFGNVNGFKTPDTFTDTFPFKIGYDHGQANIDRATYLTEMVKLNVYDGIGQTVTINNVRHDIDKNSCEIIQYVPWDTQYTISAGKKPGYKDIPDINRLAADSIYEYNIKYVQTPNGVYIVRDDGVLFDKQVWQSNHYSADRASGIYVGDGTGYHIIMGIHNLNNGNHVHWSETNEDVSGVGIESSDGKDNTDIIINTLGPGNYAASMCRDYIFKGDFTGPSYLGSVNEWRVILNNKDEIDTILKYYLYGVDKFFSTYWTSNQYDVDCAYVSNGDFRYKQSDEFARAFAKFK